MFIVKLETGGIPPRKAYHGDAGFDLFYPTNQPALTLELGDTAKIPLQFRIQGQPGYYYRIDAKSGLASKGLHVFGGVVDNNYRGIVNVNVQYLGRENITFNPGDKIAQLLVCPVVDDTDIQVVPEINMDTPRGEGGFGSTGASNEPAPVAPAPPNA